jgi:hypothetical protein
MNRTEYKTYVMNIYSKIHEYAESEEIFEKRTDDFYEAIGASFAGHSQLARILLDELSISIDTNSEDKTKH